MRAAVWHGPSDIGIEHDVPVPRTTKDELLVKVLACGLCKTDLKKIRGVTLSSKGELTPPRVFGHEIVGEIKCGRELEHLGLSEGDRVVLFHHVPCLSCYYCSRGDYTQCYTYRTVDTSCGIGEPSGGGFAQYIKVPRIIAERGMIKIPDNVSDVVATFVEPVNCCLKATSKANIKLGDNVAIFGQGPIGLILDQLATLQGANVIAVDLVTYRLEKARELRKSVWLFNALDGDFHNKIKDATSGRGADISIVAVESTKAIEHAIECTRGGGTVIFFSEFGASTEPYHLSKLVDLIYSKEITIKGCYSSSYPDHQLAADLVFSQKIKTKELVSHIFDIEQLMTGIDIADKRRHLSWEGESLAEQPRECLKVVYTLWPEEVV